MEPRPSLFAVSDEGPDAAVAAALRAEFAEIRQLVEHRVKRSGHVQVPVWLLVALLGVVITAASALTARVIALDREVALLQSTQFTDAEAFLLQSQMEARHREIIDGAPNREAELRLNRLEQIHGITNGRDEDDG